MIDTSTSATILRMSAEPGPEAKFREEYYRAQTSPRKAKQPKRASTGVDPFLLERVWMKLAQFRPIA